MNMTNKSVTSQNTSKNIEISNKFNSPSKTIHMEITILPFLWYLVIHRKYLVPIVSERYSVGGPPCSERLFKSLIIAFCLFFVGTLSFSKAFILSRTKWSHGEPTIGALKLSSAFIHRYWFNQSDYYLVMVGIDALII